MITVTADADKIMRLGADASGTEIIDETDNAMGYIADVAAAVSFMVVHAEFKYSPIVADLIIEALKNDALKNKITEKRKELAECGLGE